MTAADALNTVCRRLAGLSAEPPRTVTASAAMSGTAGRSPLQRRRRGDLAARMSPWAGPCCRRQPHPPLGNRDRCLWGAGWQTNRADASTCGVTRAARSPGTHWRDPGHQLPPRRRAPTSSWRGCRTCCHRVTRTPCPAPGARFLVRRQTTANTNQGNTTTFGRRSQAVSSTPRTDAFVLPKCDQGTNSLLCEEQENAP